MAENCHSGYLWHCENLIIKTRKNEIDKNVNAWKNFRMKWKTKKVQRIYVRCFTFSYFFVQLLKGNFGGIISTLAFVVFYSNLGKLVPALKIMSKVTKEVVHISQLKFVQMSSSSLKATSGWSYINHRTFGAIGQFGKMSSSSMNNSHGYTEYFRVFLLKCKDHMRVKL